MHIKPRQVQAGNFIRYFHYSEDLSAPEASSGNMVFFTDQTGEVLLESTTRNLFDEAVKAGTLKILTT
jgi:hypothetical protein